VVLAPPPSDQSPRPNDYGLCLSGVHHRAFAARRNARGTGRWATRRRTSCLDRFSYG